MVRDTLPEDLQPFEADLWRMVSDSLHMYMKEFGRVRAIISTKRGERNNINDSMRTISKTMFTYIEQGNSFLIKLADCYLIRPKKFNERLETANYPTQASFAFENQIFTQAWLPGLQPINLNVGYVPDPIDPRNSTIWLTQPGEGGWVYQLKPAQGAAVVVTSLPVTDPNQGEKKTRVQPKPSKKTKGGSNDEQ